MKKSNNVMDTTRQILTDTIRLAVEGRGYTFQTGQEYRIGSELKQFPAAWLITPGLSKTMGISRGVRHYTFDLRLIQKCKDHLAQAKEEVWVQMESHALDICNVLAKNPSVKAVTDVKCEPSEFTLSNKGELSVRLSACVLLPFGCTNA